MLSSCVSFHYTAQSRCLLLLFVLLYYGFFIYLNVVESGLAGCMFLGYVYVSIWKRTVRSFSAEKMESCLDWFFKSVGVASSSYRLHDTLPFPCWSGCQCLVWGWKFGAHLSLMQRFCIQSTRTHSCKKKIPPPSTKEIAFFLLCSFLWLIIESLHLSCMSNLV